MSPRQFVALGFVALLSPLARRFPQLLVGQSGAAAWMAVPAGALLALGLLPLLRLLLRGGKGLGELSELALGRTLGRLLTGIATLWLIFHCGFIFRSGAYRFVATVYPQSSPAIFILVSALLALIMGCGSASALGRCAMLLRPLLLAVLLAVFALAMSKADFRGLGQFEPSQSLSLGRSALSLTAALGSTLYILYAAGRCAEPPGYGELAKWTLAAALIVELMCLGCLSTLGPELTVKLNYPFFMLVRDLGIFDSPVRLEALTLALWTFADAVHSALLIYVARLNLCRALRAEESGRLGRLIGPLCALAAAVLALCMAPDMLGLGLLSEKFVPTGNAVLAFVLLPLIIIVGGIRKKL